MVVLALMAKPYAKQATAREMNGFLLGLQDDSRVKTFKIKITAEKSNIYDVDLEKLVFNATQAVLRLHKVTYFELHGHLLQKHKKYELPELLVEITKKIQKCCQYPDLAEAFINRCLQRGAESLVLARYVAMALKDTHKGKILQSLLDTRSVMYEKQSAEHHVYRLAADGNLEEVNFGYLASSHDIYLCDMPAMVVCDENYKLPGSNKKLPKGKGIGRLARYRELLPEQCRAVAAAKGYVVARPPAVSVPVDAVEAGAAAEPEISGKDAHEEPSAPAAPAVSSEHPPESAIPVAGTVDGVAIGGDVSKIPVGRVVSPVAEGELEPSDPDATHEENQELPPVSSESEGDCSSVAEGAKEPEVALNSEESSDDGEDKEQQQGAPAVGGAGDHYEMPEMQEPPSAPIRIDRPFEASHRGESGRRDRDAKPEGGDGVAL